MESKQKAHDMRDDVYPPLSTVTKIDEQLTGAAPSDIDPEKGNSVLVRLEPGKNATTDQTTNG